MEEIVKQEEEKMNNPFYITLKAQKEERDKFIDFYSSGVLLGLPSLPPSEATKLESFALTPKTARSNNDDFIAAIERDGAR